MLDPIWGSFDQVGQWTIGHVETFFSWFKYSINFNGELSLEILKGDAGGFSLKGLFFTLVVEIKWPTASSLVRGEPAAFLSALFLAVLLNPYFDIITLPRSFFKKISSLTSNNNRKVTLLVYTILETSLFVIFLVWSAIEVIRIFPVGHS